MCQLSTESSSSCPLNNTSDNTSESITTARTTPVEDAVMTTTDTTDTTNMTTIRIRRKKRDKDGKCHNTSILQSNIQQQPQQRIITIKKSRANQKHGNDKPSGGYESLIPSLLGVLLLIICTMGKLGFRGRPTLAGIDLGTTNSVICIQTKQPSSLSLSSLTLSMNSGDTKTSFIDCIKDPITNSPIIPSVVSFLETHEQNQNKRKDNNNKQKQSLLYPNPSMVIVGEYAKHRINSHPHHTLYHAKRVIGKTSLLDPAVQTLINEVEFGVVLKQVGNNNGNHANVNNNNDDDNNEDSNEDNNELFFTVPDTDQYISPIQVGGYIIHYLITIMDEYLHHENIRTAIICVPAKFTQYQRQLTVNAYTLAGIKVSRIIEEPTAAALAYGLHKKSNVNHIMIYDFGGGTLDISILYVSQNFVDVLGSDGDDTLGGTDFDINIANYLLKQYVYQSTNNNTNTDNTTDISIQNNSTNIPSNVTGQEIVDIVTNVLKKLYNDEMKRYNNDNNNEQKPSNNNNKKKKHIVDFEEILSSTCPKLSSIAPLCTISSLHMIGEQIKIDLSNQYDIYEKENNNDVDNNVDNNNNDHDHIKNNNIISNTAQCYGLWNVNEDYNNYYDNTIHTIHDFCNELTLISLSSISYNTLINDISNELFIRSIIPIERILDTLNLNVNDIDEIVMVGGTTRMPHIRTLVKSYMKTNHLNIDIDPDITIAYGAASVID